MTEKPRRPKRPSDVIANAIKVARIATGEDEDVYVEKDETAAAAGRKGGKARAHSLDDAERSDIAQRAARKRWGR